MMACSIYTLFIQSMGRDIVSAHRGVASSASKVPGHSTVPVPSLVDDLNWLALGLGSVNFQSSTSPPSKPDIHIFRSSNSTRPTSTWVSSIVKPTSMLSLPPRQPESICESSSVLSALVPLLSSPPRPLKLTVQKAAFACDPHDSVRASKLSDMRSAFLFFLVSQHRRRRQYFYQGYSCANCRSPFHVRLCPLWPSMRPNTREPETTCRDLLSFGFSNSFGRSVQRLRNGGGCPFR